ncbi:MAG TPA: glycosyltransferase [Candidatus Acidoferrales bacterium]|nr:glycosyltransferase [Candidatus Acidoferrales bacterium]
MHILWTALLGLIAFLWVLASVDLARGVPSMPSLADADPLPDAQCPRVSILFAARDEAEKLPGALATFLSLDYPDYEVIAVDDRSDDATGAILEAAAARDARLKRVRVDKLPAGWLGKPHALEQAYEHATGDWLIFTDADVHFAPDVLRRSIALANALEWDHMTLLGALKMFTFGEKIAMTFFAMAFAIGTRPWAASDPGSRMYSGVGAFQMIRRSTYEAIGTHRRLAMEVVDDMKLGKLVKDGGFRSGAAKAGGSVSVHWHAGVGNMIRGTTKNFFATSGFKLWLTGVHIFGLLLMCVFPVAALAFTHGWARGFDAVAVALPLIIAAGAARQFDAPGVYALTYPIGALIFAWMLARSTIVTLWQGGIIWRGTFYPLDELKRGVV